ncbi:bifunctional metallophosphatase/5'-nucleotidase [Diaphorobacter caeni]|uniref:bifunctional metallophosphatase/5'-nucleotidase n=1 Tax=Diaphorobacter caeni TaxID=2784387 RepID=UPI0018900706|nr:bifunctional metallophosphatase/5'-nucleotidase [Diaphorobacter caeni]MBF5004640.1 bifunctional metallophosphatase/5'-nucleotidase [Diaphorobacter caeni]
MEITLLGFNDFHGHLEPPGVAVTATGASGKSVAVPAGGAAYLAGAIAARRSANKHTAVVTAGDMVGASPMVSSLFLDEPTVEALNLMGVDFSATGNHEYDQGSQELLRLQNGGCEKFTAKQPCQISKPFKGAQFPFLAANTLRADGTSLLQGTGVKFFEENGARIGVGFIGMTLRTTPRMVRPSGVAGLSFADEADTANRLIPALRAQGADVIVVLIHEGGYATSGLQDASCAGLSGDILPILDRLSPDVDVVISGHTHQAYLCDYRRVNPSKPFLLTSAGRYGTLLTEVQLKVDTGSRKVMHKSARQIIVQGEAIASGSGKVPLQPEFPVFGADAAVSQLVSTYHSSVAPLAAQASGVLMGGASRTPGKAGERVLGRLVADSMLYATHDLASGGAQIAFTNPGGVRADLLPDAATGVVTYGQLYAVLPFGNNLVVASFTGEQIQRLLEQQFASGTNTVTQPRILQVSRGFSYGFDLSGPAGQRIVDMRLDGAPIQMTETYRIAIQSYLSTGGDNFSVFTEGKDVMGGMLDLDALVAYVGEGTAQQPLALPLAARIERLD